MQDERTKEMIGLTHEVALPPKLYRIGEIMEHTALSRQTVHIYTMLGLISEAERTKGNQRLYSEETFHRLARIKELKAARKKLREIRDILDTEAAASGSGQQAKES